MHMCHLHHGNQRQQDQTHHGHQLQSVGLWAALPAEMSLRSGQPATSTSRIHTYWTQSDTGWTPGGARQLRLSPESDRRPGAPSFPRFVRKGWETPIHLIHARSKSYPEFSRSDGRQPCPASFVYTVGQ
jgi:hypothetical protein